MDARDSGAGRANPTAVEFGRWLQSWRHRRRLTQQQLADQLGYDITYIAKIEGGDRRQSGAFVARLSVVAGQNEEALLRAAVAHAAMGGDVTSWAIPQPPDGVIGREQELDALIRLLGGPARCVTLVGPPGIGKTRLAIEVAARAAHLFPGGIWWVPLSEVADPDDVAPRVRRAVGVADGDPTDPIGTVVERLRTVDALIVIDNFEHVVDARLALSSLIEGTSRLKILVTSREALQLRAEYVFPVIPLAFPDPSTGPSIGAVRGSPAVELFVARATMARPQFRLTSANYGAVLRACARLAGVPLAIVLAAGGVKMFGVNRLADQIDQHVDVIYGAPADMPARHDTLAAAIGWSWERLGEDEQRLLSVSAVFIGGFTAEALAAVAGIGEDQAWSELGELARKSLVEPRPDSPVGERFELLETIRAFAIKQLEPRHHDELLERHAAFFAGFADDCGRRLIGVDQVRCAHSFAAELGNLQAAFDWSLRHEAVQALRIAASSWRSFLMSDIPTGRQWLSDALGACPDASRDRATALAASGALAWVTGHPEQAQRLLEEAALLAKQLGLADVACLVLINQGAQAEQQGRLGDANDCFVEALIAYDAAGDRRGRAFALNGLGVVRRRQGEVEKASELWIEAAAIFHEIGDATSEALALGNLAWAAENQGRLDEANEISKECRRLQTMLGDARGVAATTSALGRIAFLRGDLQTAASLQSDALRRFQRLGDLPWLASTLVALGAIAAQQRSYESAARFSGAAQTLRDTMAVKAREDEQLVIDTIGKQCVCATSEGRYNRAFARGRLMTIDDAIELASADPTVGNVT